MVRRIPPTSAAAAVLVVATVGAAGCNGAPTTPVATTVGGDRICHMFSRAAVRTVAGGEDPKVKKADVNADPGDGSLLDAVCVLEAGDLYLQGNVTWKATPAERSRTRTDLTQPPSGESVRTFPAAEGTGYVRTTRAREGEIDGGLLRGQYSIDIVLINVPEPRDPLADAQALVLQMADALSVPVDENAARPKAPAA